MHNFDMRLLIYEIRTLKEEKAKLVELLLKEFTSIEDFEKAKAEVLKEVL